MQRTCRRSWAAVLVCVNIVVIMACGIWFHQTRRLYPRVYRLEKWKVEIVPADVEPEAIVASFGPLGHDASHVFVAWRTSEGAFYRKYPLFKGSRRKWPRETVIDLSEGHSLSAELFVELLEFENILRSLPRAAEETRLGWGELLLYYQQGAAARKYRTERYRLRGINASDDLWGLTGWNRVVYD